MTDRRRRHRWRGHDQQLVAVKAVPEKIIVGLRIAPDDDGVPLFDQVDKTVLDGHLDPDIRVESPWITRLARPNPPCVATILKSVKAKRSTE
jgi:hypothetical protein